MGYLSDAAEFCDFMNDNPTVFHFTQATARLLDAAGFLQVSERDPASLERGKRYYIIRNGTNIIAFCIGSNFVPGTDGFGIAGTHVDANRMVLRPSSERNGLDGTQLLGVAQYGGGINSTWWDRDLGLGGRVVVRDSGCIRTRLVRLPGVIGNIPSLAPHFGPIAKEQNKETNMVPLIGTTSGPGRPSAEERSSPLYGKHSLDLIRAVARELRVSAANILDWELELFSDEPAKVGGLNSEFLYSSRMDDKLCSYAAIKGLMEAPADPHLVQVAALYDNEEIGSLSRQGAAGNLLQVVSDLVFDSLGATSDERAQSMARSTLISADVTHAGNPNYPKAYIKGLAPALNTGMTIKCLGHFSTTPIGAALAHKVSDHASQQYQEFAPRNDTATGGTIGNIVAAATGILTVDVGIPILAMHSIRETTGSRDIRLGISWFKSYFTIASGFNVLD